MSRESTAFSSFFILVTTSSSLQSTPLSLVSFFSPRWSTINFFSRKLAVMAVMATNFYIHQQDTPTQQSSHLSIPHLLIVPLNAHYPPPSSSPYSPYSPTGSSIPDIF